MHYTNDVKYSIGRKSFLNWQLNFSLTTWICNYKGVSRLKFKKSALLTNFNLLYDFSNG